MPTREPESRVTQEQAREIASASCAAQAEDAPRVGRVGLEPELFPVRVDSDGRPRGRVLLEEPGGVVEVVDSVAASGGWIVPRDPARPVPEYDLTGGGRLTFEPGGQVEHSTAVHASAGAALDDLQRVYEALSEAFGARGAVLAACGIDPWHDVGRIPQQLRAPRYRCMAEYFDRRGAAGRVMMRHSASLQVNLDMGPPQVARRRWHVTNLVSPLVTATFAASPGPDAVSLRAIAWQQLDPTRTGFPPGILVRDGEPLECHWFEAAMHADVLLFRLPDGGAEPGTPGFSFRRWLRHGHPVHGWPTVEDFRYHLTTLFFEVRPRGFLEMRAADAVPPPWRPALVVLLCGLIYDDVALEAALGLLDPVRERLPALWHRAARIGVRDAELGSLADGVWDIALAGAGRLPGGFFRPGDLEVTAAYLDRFPRRRRMPADELADALAQGPEQALQWTIGRG